MPEMKDEIHHCFDPCFSEKAKLEFNVNECGVSIVGNAEGYLSLARFCTFLAEVHMLMRAEPSESDANTVHGYGAYHLSHYVTKKAIKEGSFIFSPGPIKHIQADECTQDILFRISDVIGPPFWKGETESESSKEWINDSSSMAFD